MHLSALKSIIIIILLSLKVLTTNHSKIKPRQISFYLFAIMYNFNLIFLSALLGSTSAFAPNNLQPRAQASSSTALDATIAVIGSSGLLASECVYQALQDGDEVVGLTRKPSNVVIPQGSGEDSAGKPLVDPKFTNLGGDVTKLADVKKVFDEKDIDGVIIALGGKTSDVGDTMLTDGTKNVVECMKEKGIKRLAVVTSIGAGDSESQAPFFFKVLMWTAMKKIFRVSW